MGAACKGDDEQLSFNAPKSRGASGLRARHLLTIPAGRIPSSPCREWTVDLDGNVHATKHDGAGTGEAREKAGGYNEFPVQAWVYYKAAADIPADLTRDQLGELAWILANISKPMSPSGLAEEPCIWTHANGKAIHLPLRYFSHGELTGLPIGSSLQPHDCERIVDGVVATTTQGYFLELGVPKETSSVIGSNLAAGTMSDVTRIFEPCTTARAAWLSGAVGDPVGGTLGGTYAGKTDTRPCEVCGESTTTGFKIRSTARDLKVQEAITTLQKERAARIIKRHLKTWRELGLGHPELTKQQKELLSAAQVKAAKAASILQKNHDRGTRREARGGETGIGGAASQLIPITPTLHNRVGQWSSWSKSPKPQSEQAKI